MESKVRMPSDVANVGTLGGFNEKFTQKDGEEEVNFAFGFVLCGLEFNKTNEIVTKSAHKSVPEGLEIFKGTVSTGPLARGNLISPTDHLVLHSTGHPNSKSCFIDILFTSARK